MYQIYYNDSLIYDPRLANEPGDVSHAIEDGTLTMAVGSGGQLTITLPAGHPMIGTIELKSGIVTVVEVLPRGTSTVFLGRAISDEMNFDNSHTYQCEGALAFLNDSVVQPGSFPPYAWPWEEYLEYEAAVNANTTPAYRLGKLLAAHNAMTGSNIQLGTVTVQGGAMDYKAQDWLTTWERINSELLDVFGGFLSVRYSGDTVYLDYLASTADFTAWNGQVISFGANLAEIKRKTGSSEAFNAILPVNADYGRPLLDWLTLPDGYYGDNNEFYKSGLVLKMADAPSVVVRYVEIKMPNSYSAQDAIDAAMAYLAATADVYVSELTVRAYDMSANDPGTQPFRAGKLVKILDPPHGIREAYLVMGVTIDLTGGADVDLDLGARATSLTSSGAQRIIEEDTSKRVPQVLYRNTSPSSSQSSGALSSIGDISAYNLFFVEVCWSTGYTSHRGGTWVYVPDGTSVIAHPSVDWTDSGAAHAYRQVTIDKSASAGAQISLGTGNSATPSGTSSGTSYAIVTTIIGYTV